MPPMTAAQRKESLPPDATPTLRSVVGRGYCNFSAAGSCGRGTPAAFSNRGFFDGPAPSPRSPTGRRTTPRMSALSRFRTVLNQVSTVLGDRDRAQLGLAPLPPPALRRYYHRPIEGC